MYDKKIKYLELWENGEKQQTAGFVKVEVLDELVNIQIKVEKLRLTDCGNVTVVLQAAQKEAKLGEVLLEVGKGSELWQGLCANNLVDEIGYDELEQIKINLRGGRELCCILQEKQKPIEKIVDYERKRVDVQKSQEMVIEPIVEKPEIIQEEPITLESMLEAAKIEEQETVKENLEREEQAGVAVEAAQIEEEEGVLIVPIPLQMEEEKPKTNQPLASTKWQQLWNIYPHINPFEDNREYLRMKPEDFVVLTQEFYPLSSNSFLLHGYYNYNHVILCREVKQREEKYYIGVPGNFYPKEKQVAVLFGFESFEGKEEPAKNGDFGYYMIRVQI